MNSRPLSSEPPKPSEPEESAPEQAETFGFSSAPEEDAGRQMTYLAAISEALREEMRRDPTVLLLGEDIAGDFGGAFKVTKGFEEEFGARRVRNMPIAEAGFVSAATGMALMGLRPVIEMQFADFISSAFDAIVQFAATCHYRWGGAVPWVIRAPSDGGLRSGPFHSQNPEAWFVHTPGLKVVAPATPADAKGLLIAAIRDNNPVIFFESKPLYRTAKGYVSAGAQAVPIGKARVARSGSDLSIIAYGAQVREALEAADTLAAEGVDVEVLDLRSLKPLDVDAILASARKTGRVLVVHSANRLAGVGAEVAALIADEAFEWLDAPVRRIGGLDTPVPFSPPLEDAHRPDAARILAAARELARF
jgi:2-oxoisovalerate dehydrogenase E1 component beta subunit